LKRGRKVVLLSHCILNANSKVERLSDYEGIIPSVAQILIEKGIGVIQLPCPELLNCGIRRWGQVKEQYDNFHFRQECRKMLMPIISQVSDYIAAGYKVLGVVGIDGSPSCGVEITCSGDWKGELCGNPGLDETIGTLKMVSGKGVFMEEFSRLLEEHGINLPFTAVDESDMVSSAANISKIL